MKKLIMISSVFAVALAIGCGSQLVDFPEDNSTPDTNPPSADGGKTPDTGNVNPDTGNTNPCANVVCTDGAVCKNGVCVVPTTPDSGVADTGVCSHDKCHKKCEEVKETCYGSCHNCEGDRDYCREKCSHDECSETRKECDDKCDCDFDSCDKERTKHHEECDCTYNECIKVCDNGPCDDCGGK